MGGSISCQSKATLLIRSRKVLFPRFKSEAEFIMLNKLRCYVHVPTHVVTLTQVGASVYLGQTHLGTPLQVPAWVRKFSLGPTGDEISSLIIIEGLFVQQKFEY